MGKKKDKGIRLSPKHGINPSMVVCTICGKETGEIALLGKIGKGKEDKEAPKHICTGDICNDCMKNLEDNKLRCFISSTEGKYIKLPDDCLNKDYLEGVGDTRLIFLPPDDFKIIEDELKKASTSEGGD